MARVRASITSGATENNIYFYPAGGHSHDGQNSSLIDTTQYSVYDFNFGYISDNPVRRQFQINSFESLKQVIKDTVTDSILTPAGIVLQPNTLNGSTIIARTITADQITVGSITASELSNNIILVNNTIRSNNYAVGVSGWQISNTGSAEFNNVTVRGTVSANSGNIAGWTINASNITGGSTVLYSNGYINAASGSFTGSISASSGTIGGWTIAASRLYSGSTSLYSNGTISGAAISGGTVTGAAIYSGAFYTQGDANTGIGVQIYNSALVCYKLNGVLNLFVDNSNTGGVTIGSLTVNYGTSLVGNVSAPGGFIANSNGVYGYLFSATVGVYAPYMEATTSFRVKESGGAANDPYTTFTTNQANTIITRSILVNDVRDNKTIYMHNGTQGTYYGTAYFPNVSTMSSGASRDAIFDDNKQLIYYSSYSSRRYKNSITSDIPEYQPEKILQLRLVKFKYNEDLFEENEKYKANEYLYGLVAEETEEIWPQAVGKNSDNLPDYIDNKQFILPLIGTVQYLNNKINDLENRIKMLEGV